MSTAIRYNLAWNYVWESYKDWKRAALLDEIHENKNGRFFNEFTKEVRRLAESQQDIPKVKSNYVLTTDAEGHPEMVISGSFNQ
jgi:hypothetical protein